MKVLLGPYTNWVGPYQIAEKILWWMDKYEDDRVHNFGTWLANDRHGNESWLMKFCNWVQKFKRRQEYVRIDHYDHWNMDHTLSLIIAPLLVELKNHKHGYGFIDDADVPEHLQSKFGVKHNDWDWDSLAEKRFEWFLDELIWAFTAHKSDDEHDQFYDHGEKIAGESLMDSVARIKVDQAGLDAHNARKQHAFNMFGKYFQNLWD